MNYVQNFATAVFLVMVLVEMIRLRRRSVEAERAESAELSLLEKANLEVITLQAKYNRLLGEKAQVESEREEYRNGFLASKASRALLAAANERGLKELAALKARLKKAHR